MLIHCTLIGGALALQSPPATEPSTQPAPILAGPSAQEEMRAQPTIVHRTLDGALEDVGPEADLAALRLLDLSEEQKAKLEMLVAERTSHFDGLVRKNYGLIVELGAAFAGQERAQMIALGQQVREAFADYIVRGPVMEEFGGELAPEQKTQLQAMMREYVQARLTDYRRTLGDDVPTAQILTRARLERSANWSSNRSSARFRSSASSSSPSRRNLI